MRPHLPGLTVGLVLLAALTGAQAQNAPRVGYAYPAGAQRGTVLRVAVGGQYLQEAEGVHVSGEGVEAVVLEHARALDDNELWRTQQFMYEMVRRRWNAAAMAQARARDAEEPPLPDHPWLRDLEERSPLELARLRAVLFNPRKQPNAQISEQVAVEVTVAPDAPAGDRELRLVTAAGLSNPVSFQVGTLPEAREGELGAPGEPARAVDLPVLLNGQVMPGEVDRFRLRARQGQRLVVRVEARRLTPYLADAVPGWFQAAVSLRDPAGREVAYADDYLFGPDPVLCYEVPRDGVYGLEIHDALFRGREDFVYRVSVGELPFITGLFPLGAAQGARVESQVRGWNLAETALPLDTQAGGGAIRSAAVGQSNLVRYAVDELPECAEAEPHDAADGAQQVALPVIVNGRIGRPGEVDVFGFEGAAGEEVVAEVVARRLGSPLDAALRLVGPGGEVVAANDDHDDPEAGLLPHQADPYLRVTLPADGAYHVFVMDAQGQGGEECAYRLRLSAPRPDFTLRATPSSLSMPGHRPAQLTFRVVRKDGFAGEVELALAEAPAGLWLSEARIPGDKDMVQAALGTTPEVPYGVFQVRLVGRAQIGGQEVTRPVVPAEDQMQAFAYRHLVPQQELLVAVTGAKRVPAVWRPLARGIEVVGEGPVRLPRGGTSQVTLRAPQTLPDRLRVPLAAVRFALCDPPRGIRLQGTRVTPTGVILTLKADANSSRLGLLANLIVEAAVEREPAREEGLAVAASRRVSLGVLPAIPVQVVSRTP